VKFAPKTCCHYHHHPLMFSHICKQTKGCVTPRPCHLSMKEGSLFCFVFVGMRSTKLGSSDHLLGIFGKLSMRRGAWAWFHDGRTCGSKVLEYWMIFSLKIKLNCSWKFEELECAFGVVGKILMRGFNGVYLLRSGFRMWEILIFKWFLLLIQINSKKPGFGRKDQLRTW
jgi:hypothetical protein